MTDMAALFEYACTIHNGAGKLSYQFVDMNTMEIIKRPVGDRKKAKPVVCVKGLYVTYEELSKAGRYQMWVGQEWADVEDSPTIKAARASIDKRSASINTYEDGDDVLLTSAGENPTVVKVPYANVTAYLAQRLGFRVAANDSGEGKGRQLVTDDEEDDEEGEGDDSGAESGSSFGDHGSKKTANAPKPLAPKTIPPKLLTTKRQELTPKANVSKQPVYNKQPVSKQPLVSKSNVSTQPATVDDDNKSTASSSHLQSKEVLDDDDDEVDMTKTERTKRKSSSDINDTPKRARQSQQVSDGMLRDIIKEIVSKDLARIEVNENSLDGACRLAKTLVDELGRIAGK